MDTPLSLPGLPAPRLPHLAERAAQTRTAARPEAEAAAGPDSARRAQLRNAANEFESVFVSQMLGHVFEGMEVDDTFGGGRGEEMFRSLLTNEYGKQVTRRGGFGIADQVYRELLRAQEGAHGQG